MSSKSNKVTQLFSTKKVAIPIVIGLGVAFYMLWSNTDWNEFKKTEWGFTSFFWLLIALSMMMMRDVAYMYRIRILTDKKISWRNSFDVIMLWEFASAITPSVVGGTGVALFILNKEGISAGKSTAVVMITAFMDELFYIIMVPLIIVIIGTQHLFPVESLQAFGVTLPAKEIFVVGYLFILMLTVIILYGVFINPRGFKSLLLMVLKIRFLKKWRYKAIKVGDDIIQTSKELKGQPFSFWAKAMMATFFSWTARFWVVNFLILAFIPVGNHFLIYGRQLVMWVIMLISPTPGGAGIAEFAFDGFLKEFTPLGLAGLLAVLWRLASYYPYLFIGAIVLPKWLKRVYS